MCWGCINKPCFIARGFSLPTKRGPVSQTGCALEYLVPATYCVQAGIAIGSKFGSKTIVSLACVLPRTKGET